MQPDRFVFHNRKFYARLRCETRAFFFVSFFRFYVVKLIKNTQKCKKIKKNEKKCKKNLHISKKCCTFAPNLKNNPISNPKNQQDYEQKLFNKELRRNPTEHGNN